MIQIGKRSHRFERFIVIGSPHFHLDPRPRREQANRNDVAFHHAAVDITRCFCPDHTS
jgi:hypothetical protein